MTVIHEPLTGTYPYPKGYEYQSSTNKIRHITEITDKFAESHRRFSEIEDIGMDRYFVSQGEPLGTSGVGCCLAICSIGTTSSKTPVLGLCHTSNTMPIKDVLEILKGSMTAKGAVRNTIETYVIGGAIPSKDNEGTLEEEKEIKALAEQENIKGYLFNLVVGEDGALDVILTPRHVYVSTELLIFQSEDAGISLSKKRPAEQGHVEAHDVLNAFSSLAAKRIRKN